MAGRIRVFIACSLDGFIAGEGDDLSWLTDAPGEEPPEDAGYAQFFSEVGALLMGRGTYEVVRRFDRWYYEDRPVLVATHRDLEPAVPTVRAVQGEIHALLRLAREAAGTRDVYLDGGHLIRQALDAGLVDELTVTMVPTILGRGHPLFAGAGRRHRLELLSVRRLGGGLVQLRLAPAR